MDNTKGSDLAPGDIVHRLARSPYPSDGSGCALCVVAGRRIDAPASLDDHDPGCAWRLACEWDAAITKLMQDAGIDICPHCNTPLTSSS